MKFVALLLIAILPIQWEPDFDTAKKMAKEKNELILLSFSGSDWCGPCILFRRDYLESQAFSDYAKDNIVLVNADFPRKSKNQLPAETVKRNNALAEVYNKQGDFPLTLILDANGKVLKAWSGKPRETPEEWIAEVKALKAAHQ